MKRILLFAFSVALLSFTVSTTWVLDTNHSNLVFSVGHLGVSEIVGSLHITQSTIIAQGEDLADANVTLEIDMKSIDTDNEKRDTHLRTPDFFDTEKYPAATFTSTSCKKDGTG